MRTNYALLVLILKMRCIFFVNVLSISHSIQNSMWILIICLVVSSSKEMFISLMASTEENNLKSVSIYVNECNIS